VWALLRGIAISRRPTATGLRLFGGTGYGLLRQGQRKRPVHVLHRVHGILLKRVGAFSVALPTSPPCGRNALLYLVPLHTWRNGDARTPARYRGLHTAASSLATLGFCRRGPCRSRRTTMPQPYEPSHSPQPPIPGQPQPAPYEPSPLHPYPGNPQHPYPSEPVHPYPGTQPEPTPDTTIGQ
jgi:hypothetical protein